MEKPDCYKCIYRGEVVGSAHSCCKHPNNKKLLDEPMAGLLGILSSGRHMDLGLKSYNNGLNVTGNEHGRKSGWFNYPLNFDPVWLETCDGFKREEVNKNETT
ncbi:hypothetical protein [Shewanella sp.]|jgi:hypothetical protein|uniref:hypothetical protein n=1 Tax=Shewanella sp. TaxID=50422 RepID=UPI0035651719